MSQDSAFRPAGPTVLVNASSSTAGTATQWSTGNMDQVYICNGSTRAIYLAFGSSTVQAAVPTSAVPSYGVAMPSSSSRCFTFGPSISNAGWISVVTSLDSSASVFITPGKGF